MARPQSPGPLAFPLATTPAGEEIYLVPRADLERLMALHAEVLADRLAADDEDAEAAEDAGVRRIVARAAGEPRLPAEAWDRIEAGEPPIRVLRELRGLTQAALAEAVGVSQAYLSKIENRAADGKPATLMSLARALDAPLAVLFENEPDPGRRDAGRGWADAIARDQGGKA